VTYNHPYYSGEPAIAATESMIYVAWEDYRDGNYEIYFKKSLTGEAGTWSNDLRLSNTQANSWRPRIAAKGSNVYVVWEENQSNLGINLSAVYFLTSANQGKTWSIPEKVNMNPAYAAFPAIFANDTCVYMTWEDSRAGNDEIFMRRRNASGWLPDIRLTYDPSDSWSSAVAVDSKGVIHVVWYDYRDGNDEIYYKNSPDNGATWSADMRLTFNPEISWDPRIAIDSADNLHVVWYDWRDQKDEVYYKRSTNGGTQWSVDTRLSTLDNADSRYPDVACLQNKIYVAWEDYRDGNDEIYCNISLNQGANWQGITRLTNDPSNSWAAVVATNSKGAYITWQDYRTGNDEVWDKLAQPPSGISSTIAVGALDRRALLSNSPNPFKHSTVITYDPHLGQTIGIFSTQGRLIKSLYDISRTGRLEWDGTNKLGQTVAPGLYIYKILGVTTAASQTIMVLP
jgi:hypothetical protein